MDAALRPSDKRTACILTGWQQTFLSGEALLWLALAVLAAFREPWKLTCLVAVPLTRHYCDRPGRRPHRDGTSSTPWRQPKSSADRRDTQGTLAGTILVPVLLFAMAKQTPEGDILECLALSSLTLRFDFKFASWIERIPDAVRLALALLLFSSHKMMWSRSLLLSVFLLHASYHSINFVPTLHGVFTRGEWEIVSSLMAATLSIWRLTSDRRHAVATGNLHNEVAFAGVASSLAACAALGLAFSQRLPLTVKVAVLTLTPLLAIEILLLVQSSDTSFPRSIVWLVTFLRETEDSSLENAPWIRRIATFPRYYWLIYWIAVLAITMLPAASASNNSFNDEKLTIVGRKWFHLVAVLLFAPVTLAAPQLQSLSYAIALAALMVLESIRSHVPALNAFYSRYLDPVKDERGERVVVSHMALVVGCAAPLWIAEYCSWPLSSSLTVKSYLSSWGFLCLGVGDAMGAVFGVFFGRHCWSADNPRTLEGSAAMFLSVSIPSWFLLRDWAVWVPAVAFATLVEAWTFQLDNLILPLAGSAVVLLLHQLRLENL